MARIGLMGCGSVADFGHLPAIIQTPGLELVALYDPDDRRVHELASRFGFPAAFTDQKAFFDTPMDAVVVSSPPWAHKENVVEAARRGLHILCEKPIAMNEQDGLEIIEAVEAEGKSLVTGFVYRFSPVAQQMKRWVEEGIVGKVQSLRLIYVWDLHGQWERDDLGKWIESPRWRGRMLEGGPMVDCGVHQIDLARWWLGEEIVRHTASGAWVAEYEAPDHVYLHLDHERGAHTMVEMSFTYGHTARDAAPQFSYDLIGTGGVLHYDRNGYVLEARHGQGTLRVPGASEKNFPGMHAAFAHALNTGDFSGLPTGRDGLIATRIAREATDNVIAGRLPVAKAVKAQLA